MIIAIIIFACFGWGYYQFYSVNQITPTDVLFNIFVEVLGTGLTILVLDKLWHAEEIKRWDEVKKEVIELLHGEVDDIFLEFALFLIPPEMFVLESEDEKELEQKIKEYQKNELTKLAKGDLKEIENRIIENKLLINGGYGDLFRKRYESLNNIELKYSKFLEPSILRVMIRLETEMKALDSGIKARLNLKRQNKYGEFLIPSLERGIFHHVHEIVKILDEAREIRVLTLTS